MKGILWAVVKSADAVFSFVNPIHEKVFGHHITLAFGVELTPELESLIGREFEAIAYDEAFDATAHALRVELPADVPCANAHPHLTISTAGVPPKASNDMLAAVPLGFNPTLLRIPCRIEFKPFEPR